MASIFHQPWWLDAVAPGQWQEIQVHRGAEVAAKMPIYMKKKYGLTILTMPKLTQVLGPVLNLSSEKYAKQLAEQKQLMSELIEQLPSFDYFIQNFHYSITNWLPFYWAGFNQTTRYTYVLEDIRDPERLYSGFVDNVKRNIRKATNQVTVRTDLGIEPFIELNKMTFQRQGMKLPWSTDVMRRLDAACDQNQSRGIWFAEDAKGRLHAAVYIVWDKDSAYYLMGGSDPELRKSGAYSLLMWEAIRFCSTVTNRFDFEGSMIEPVENFFRGFGARQVPYFEVTKANRKMKILMQGRDWVQEIRKIAPFSGRPQKGVMNHE